MRAREFIIELKQGKIKKRHQQSTVGLNTFSDNNKWASDYLQYRLGLAVACANGRDPLDVDSRSWIGQLKTSYPYNKEEQEMLKQAYKAVGAKYDDINKGDMVSKELDSTNTVSPVANWNKTK